VKSFKKRRIGEEGIGLRRCRRFYSFLGIVLTWDLSQSQPEILIDNGQTSLNLTVIRYLCFVDIFQ
jgi:hypothetical protein